jgi:hypothetical protein
MEWEAPKILWHSNVRAALWGAVCDAAADGVVLL